jgi:predicted DNA-binding transcriptional regulator AlpA
MDDAAVLGHAHAKPLLNEADAALYLSLSLTTLRRHRAAGTGPRCVRFGRLVRYRVCDLDAFVESCVQQTDASAEVPRG